MHLLRKSCGNRPEGYFLQNSNKLSKFMKVSFMSIHFLRNTSWQHKHNSRKILSGNTFFKLLTRFLQDIYYLQEPCKRFIVCKNLEKYLFFARTLQDFYCLDGLCKTSIICKILARYFSIGRTLQDNFYLHETGNFSINRRNHETYLVFAIILDEI